MSNYRRYVRGVSLGVSGGCIVYLLYALWCLAPNPYVSVVWSAGAAAWWLWAVLWCMRDKP